MFRMIYDDGVHTSVFDCDVCKRRIENVKDGIVLYGYDPGHELTTRPDCKDIQIVVHKQCNRQRPGFLFWHELETVLVWLGQNLHFDGKTREQAEFKANALASIRF